MIEFTLNGPVSQETSRMRLISALCENRFPQAILIDGPAGIGKKALAIELAQALQCTNANKRPCMHCFGCKMATDSGATENWIVPMDSKEAHARSSDDVSFGSSAKTIEDFKKAYVEEIRKNPYRIDIFSAGAIISVDLIRAMTASFAMKIDSVRAIIIAEADRMNEAASNAFLKTLEEVPANTYFILTTSSREKMLQTIRSRCLAMHLLPLSNTEVRSEVSKYLSDVYLTDDIVGIAEGSPGKAMYFAEYGKEWFKLASDFVTKSLTANYTDLFMSLKESSLDDAYVANRFLEVLSFLIADLIRERANATQRLPNTTASVCISNYPRINTVALELSLVTIQETMTRIESRRITPIMCIQSLAIKLFEGYK